MLDRDMLDARLKRVSEHGVDLTMVGGSIVHSRGR